MSRFTTSQEVGELLRREIVGTVRVAPSVQAVGRVMAGRLARYDNVWGGHYSIARDVEKLTGWKMSERSIRYALAALKRHGYLRVRCCSGDSCRGGRRVDPKDGQVKPHAARYVVGPRQLGRRGDRRVRLFLRSKGAKSCTTLRSLREQRLSDKEKERLRRGHPGRRSDANAPNPREMAAAPREGPGEPGGAERLSSILDRFNPGR